MRTAFLICLALLVSGDLLAGETPSNRQPSKLTNIWENIYYPSPPGPSSEPGFWVGSSAQYGQESRGLWLHIMNLSWTFLKTNTITAQLCRMNGERVEPTEFGKMLLKNPVGVGSAMPGEEPPAQVTTCFPWGANALSESWIEVSMGPERYWLEIPYGFDRNPRDPLAPSIAAGPPRYIPALKALTEHDHFVRWRCVTYHLGQTQDGRELKLIQSNPFHAKCEIELYRYPETQSLYSPRTTVRILDADGAAIEGACIELHLDDSHRRRTDTFTLTGFAGKDERCWGQVEITIDDEIHSVMVPSSLYKYIHGHAMKPAATDFVSTLRVGMSLKETERTLRNYNCTRKSSTTSGGQHRFQYIFTTDGGEVTLEFDASDRLVRWK